ncbi:MAG: sialidase family protein [Limisphaerales bacterium]
MTRRPPSLRPVVAFVAVACAAVAAERHPDFARVPGVVIDHRPARSQQYVGSPSLATLPNGDYVVSHDWFGPGTSNDRTVVFSSHDRGRTWARLTELEGQWWSSLFVHRGALYLMGTSSQDGFCVIRRSTDGGKTWTKPRDNHSGLLLADGKYHCAPVPVVVHHGRLWRAMEDAMGPGGWGGHFHAFMMSAPAEADLLEAQNWTCSDRLGRNPEWLDGKFGGWLEGNAVVLYHPDPEQHGFQYVDWQFDGEDLIAVSRTADDDGLGGAHTQHDANFLTFHRFHNFRGLTPDDSPPDLRTELKRQLN